MVDVKSLVEIMFLNMIFIHKISLKIRECMFEFSI